MGRVHGVAVPVAAALLLLLVPIAAAQHFAGHGFAAAKESRPLHARLAAADAVAIGVVDRVEGGRIQIASAVPVIGATPDAFPIKRAPSNPPPLAAGDRAVLLLRGARPPYLLVDEPHEIVVPASPEESIAWLGALADLDGAVPDGERMLAVYTAWLGGPSRSLRRAGLDAVVDENAPFWPPGEATLRRLIALVGDPAVDAESRTAAALAAVAIPGGAPILMARVPGSGEGAHPQVLAAVLRAGLVRRDPMTADVFRRALRSPDPRLRLAALSLGRAFTRDPEIEREVAALVASDPDDAVRTAAAGALTRRSTEAPSPESDARND